MSSRDGPLQVLIVEDDFFVKAEVKRAVEKLGHVVAGEAANGKEGVEKALELSPDVILMDIGMSVMNGIEAAATIQEKNPTPIVFITAHESADMVHDASQAGASAYLTKPVDCSAIERTLIVSLARHGDLMELRRLNAELAERTSEIQQAMAEIKTLRSILPICSYCRRVRNEEGGWESIEQHLHEQTNSEISHGICPECFAKEHPEANERLLKKSEA